MSRTARDRAAAFCARFGLRIPILEAPMAGACPPELAAAVAAAGGMGSMGAVLTAPEGIARWVEQFRTLSGGPLQLNVWTPDPAPDRDDAAEREVATFLGRWGPEVAKDAGDARPPDFAAQCEAMLAARPTVISSIMGLFPPLFVERMKESGIAWFAVPLPSLRQRPPKPPVRMRSSLRDSRPAGIAAASMRRPPNDSWSA